MVDPVDPIVEALRQARQRRGWSQQYLAEQLGRKTYQCIYQWEHVHSVTLKNLRQWADALGFDLVLKERAP